MSHTPPLSQTVSPAATFHLPVRSSSRKAITGYLYSLYIQLVAIIRLAVTQLELKLEHTTNEHAVGTELKPY